MTVALRFSHERSLGPSCPPWSTTAPRSAPSVGGCSASRASFHIVLIRVGAGRSGSSCRIAGRAAEGGGGDEAGWVGWGRPCGCLCKLCRPGAGSGPSWWRSPAASRRRHFRAGFGALHCVLLPPRGEVRRRGRALGRWATLWGSRAARDGAAIYGQAAGGRGLAWLLRRRRHLPK